MKIMKKYTRYKNHVTLAIDIGYIGYIGGVT